MTSLSPAAASVDDGPAIAELHRLHAAQRRAFLADPYPAAAERKGAPGGPGRRWCSATAIRSGRR